MIRTIVRREFVEHITSFRFLALLVLSLTLMTLSVSVFSAKYAGAIRESPSLREGQPQGLIDDQGKTSLKMAPCNAYGLHRVLSRLAFCAGTAERELPDLIMVSPHLLNSLSRVTKAGEVLDPSVPLDWGFLVTVIFSFAAGLLTYKSVAGELTDGTLALTLSNPVPKWAILLGKYLGAMLSLAIVLSVSMLFGLVKLRVLGEVALTGDDWLKLGSFWLVSLAYLSVFVLIGLLCSIVARTPLLAAAAFLLNWSVLVFVIPNLGGIAAGLSGNVKAPRELSAMNQAFKSRYPMRNDLSLVERASIEMQRCRAYDQLLLEHLGSLMRQVEFGQNITRVSPASVFLYASEEITGGGLPRLTAFVQNARQYRERLLDAMIEADKADPASQHVYYPWQCGSNIFSQRVVDLGPAKEFRDAPPRSGQALAGATWDLGLLFLFNLLGFAIAAWRFDRKEVAHAWGA